MQSCLRGHTKAFWHLCCVMQLTFSSFSLSISTIWPRYGLSSYFMITYCPSVYFSSSLSSEKCASAWVSGLLLDWGGGTSAWDSIDWGQYTSAVEQLSNWRWVGLWQAHIWIFTKATQIPVDDLHWDKGQNLVRVADTSYWAYWWREHFVHCRDLLLCNPNDCDIFNSLLQVFTHFLWTLQVPTPKEFSLHLPSLAIY